MSSQHPILDNRPIDQWKVTELKEELKKRKLMTKGLKEELVRRLGEAIRIEMAAAEKELADQNEKESSEEVVAVDNDKDFSKEEGGNYDSKPLIETEDVKPIETQINEDTRDNGGEIFAEKVDNVATVVDINDSSAHLDQGEDVKPMETQMNEDTRDNGEILAEKVDDVATMVDINDSSAHLDQGEVQAGEPTGETVSDVLVDETVVLEHTVEIETTVCETVITQTTSSVESQDSEKQVKIEDPKPPHEDDMLNVSDSNNQVSEVNPILGFQVKCESISTDSVSIIEKNELKDSLNADNVHLELEVVKPEMVEPSSSDVPPNGGAVLPLDEQEPREIQGSIGEIDDTNATNEELSKKIDSADGGSSEKLNLDRSPGDDFMEEDVMESKQIDSNHKSDEVGDRNEVPNVKEESLVDAAGASMSSDKKDVTADNTSSAAAIPEKRKLQDQAVVENNEPPKRQRRWNSESQKVPEAPTSVLSPSTKSKETFQSPLSRRNITRSDSTVSSGSDAPKERVVPPSSKPPTSSLRIDRFLRPFTLKAVQELLAKTGTVCSFWMDHIKTHCYVTYSSPEEAKETREALYNLQWPPNGGRLLVAEFVDPQEVKNRAEAPQAPQVPVSTTTAPAAAPAFQSQPSPRQHAPREQLPPPPPLPLPPPPPLTNLPAARERIALPPPPPLPSKSDPPILTLDDLFKKTKAIPRIYYLPLSEEQVAVKLAAEKKHTKSGGFSDRQEIALGLRRVGRLLVSG